MEPLPPFSKSQFIDTEIGWISCVAFSPNSALLAVSGQGDPAIILWNVTTSVESIRLAECEQDTSSVAFSPDNEILAGGGYDNNIRLWSPQTGVLIRTLRGHSGPVTTVAFSPSDGILATGSDDATIRFWDYQTGELGSVLAGHEGMVTCVAFSPDGRLLASASEDLSIRLWDARTGYELRVLKGHTETVSSVAFDSAGSTIATGSVDESVKLWDATTGTALATLVYNRYHLGGVTSVAFQPKSPLLASAQFREDDPVVIWNVTEKRMVQLLPSYTDEAQSIAFSPNGKFLACASSGRFSGFEVWPVTT